MARQPKLPKLDHVKYVKSKGKVYAYFNTGTFNTSGKVIYTRLPDPAAVGFFDSYASFKAARTRRHATVYLVADLVRDFEVATNKRTDLSPKTKELYHHSNKHVVRTLGEYPADKVEVSDVLWMRDNAVEGVGSKKMFVTMLRIIYSWGRLNGKATNNPTLDVKGSKTGEHEPWPTEILEAGLAAADARTRLAINLLYYTGQRISDVLKMRWSDINGDEMYVFQQKTKKEVYPPIHSALAEVLDATLRTGETIMASETGAPWADDTIRGDITAFTLAAGKRCIPHGLRKNAVNALLEAGCTVAEVASITGQSFGVVEKYARKVNNRKLGKKAMKKLEDKDGTGKPDAKPREEPL